jgi:hypothetical protein
MSEPEAGDPRTRTWRDYAQHKVWCGLVRQVAYHGVPRSCTCGLDALLASEGLREQQEKEKTLARMDTMGISTDSRTAPTDEVDR